MRTLTVLGCTLLLLAYISRAESTPSVSLNPVSEENVSKTRQRRAPIDFGSVIDSAVDLSKAVVDVAKTVVDAALVLVADLLKGIGVVVYGFASALLNIPGGVPEGVVIPDTQALQNGEIKDPIVAFQVMIELFRAINKLLILKDTVKVQYVLDQMVVYLPKITVVIQKISDPSDMEGISKSLSYQVIHELYLEYCLIKVNLNALSSTTQIVTLISMIDADLVMLGNIVSYLELITISLDNKNGEDDNSIAVEHEGISESGFHEELEGVIEDSGVITSSEVSSLSENDLEDKVLIEIELSTNEVGDEHVADKDLHLDFETEDSDVDTDDYKGLSGLDEAVVTIDDYADLLSIFVNILSSGDKKNIEIVLANGVVSTKNGFHGSLAVLLDHISEITSVFKGVNKEKLLSLNISLAQLRVELSKLKVSVAVTALLQKITVVVKVITSVLNYVENMTIAAVEHLLDTFVTTIKTATPTQINSILNGETIVGPGGLKISLVFILDNIRNIHLNSEHITSAQLVTLKTLLVQLRVLLVNVPASAQLNAVIEKIFSSITTLNVVIRNLVEVELDNLNHVMINIVIILKSGDTSAIKTVITGGLIPGLSSITKQLSFLDILNRLYVILGTNQGLSSSKLLRLKYHLHDIKKALSVITEFPQVSILIEKISLVKDLVKRPLKLSKVYKIDVIIDFLKLFRQIITSGTTSQINRVLYDGPIIGQNYLKISLSSLLDIVNTFSVERYVYSTEQLVSLKSELIDLHENLLKLPQTIETVNIITKLWSALHILVELIESVESLTVKTYIDNIDVIILALKGATAAQIDKILYGDLIEGTYKKRFSIYTILDKLFTLQLHSEGISLDDLVKLNNAVERLQTELIKLPKTYVKLEIILNKVQAVVTVIKNIHTEIKAIDVNLINQFITLLVNANVQQVGVIISGGKIAGPNGKELSLLQILNLISGLNSLSVGVNKATISTLFKGLQSTYGILYKLPKTHLLNYLLRRLRITMYAVRTISLYQAQLSLEALAPVVVSFVRIIKRAPAAKKDAIIAGGVIKLAGGLEITIQHIVDYILHLKSSARGLTVRNLTNIREKFIWLRRLLWRLTRTRIVVRKLRSIAKVLNHLKTLVTEVQSLNRFQLLKAINNILQNGATQQKKAVVDGSIVSTRYLRGSFRAVLASLRRQLPPLLIRSDTYRILLTWQKNQLARSRRILLKLSFATDAIKKNVANTFARINAYLLQR